MKLISLFKTEVIEFLCLEEDYGVIPEPVPAFKEVPDWFKKVPTSIGHRDQFGGRAMSAKKCMPLIDAMSLGFVIPLAGDVNVRTNSTCALIEASDVPRFGRLIEYHDKEQLGGKTSPTYPGPAIKFINKWVVKTAPGYSTLFIPPINRIEPRFTCLGGLVDTDAYVKEVNFPAIWHLPDYDDVVEAGTPLVTCIPIKRGSVPRSATTRPMTEKEMSARRNIHERQQTRRHVYTKELRDDRS